MLKGVNRQVVEVSEPESEYFERIIYIVKPEFSNLNYSKLLKEAGKIGSYSTPPVKTLRQRKRLSPLAKFALISLAVTVLIIIAALIR